MAESLGITIIRATMKIIIHGRLLKDAKIIPTQNQSQMASLSIGVKELRKDPETKQYKAVEQFFDFISFNKDLIENIDLLTKDKNYLFEVELSSQNYQVKLVHKNFMLWSEIITPKVSRSYSTHSRTPAVLDDEVPFL